MCRGGSGDSFKAAEKHWAPLGWQKVSKQCGVGKRRDNAAGGGVGRRMGPRRRAKAADKALEGKGGREESSHRSRGDHPVRAARAQSRESGVTCIV